MSKEIRASVSARLKKERERLGWSQAALADAASAARRTVGAWESGATVPGADALALLAQHGFDALYIVTGQRTPSTFASLTPEQAMLIDDYKRADQNGQAAARRVLSSLAKG
ncbi:helix-turn-helix transcriptional regulator [Variovorax sp. OAS795]|uniref:helix-turn-helix domain-containing protein n=1 Tax=Variovorax sp. OAS795 TaxID=3034231 RepID=UPI00339B8EB4